MKSVWLTICVAAAALLPMTEASADEAPKESGPANANARGNTRPAEGADPSLDVVIAQHVLVWREQIMTWEKMAAELRALRQQRGKPIYPRFRITRGAYRTGRWANYGADGLALYNELSAPGPLPARKLLSLAPVRYDLVRTAADLTP